MDASGGSRGGGARLVFGRRALGEGTLSAAHGGAVRDSPSVVAPSANGRLRWLPPVLRGTRRRLSDPRRMDAPGGSRGGGARLVFGRRALGERMLSAAHGGAVQDSPSVVGPSANGRFRGFVPGRRGTRHRLSDPRRTDALGGSRRGCARLPGCRRADRGTGASLGSRRDGRGRAAVVGAVGEPAFRGRSGGTLPVALFPARAAPRVVNIPAQSCRRARTAAPRFRRDASGDGDSDCDSDRSRVRPACSPFPETGREAARSAGRFPRHRRSRERQGAEKGAPPLPGPERRRPPVRAAAPSPPPVVRSRLS